MAPTKKRGELLNIAALLFFLGISPSPDGNEQLIAEWNRMSHEEQKAVIRQFEEEYETDFMSLKDSDFQELSRKINLRSWDQRGD